MTTSIVDTGEAYLTAAEKRFARIEARPPAFRPDVIPAVSPVLTGAVLALAVAAVAVAALIG